MTKEKILAMEAGPELDALVSERVMRDIPGQAMVREYSTDIAAAWEVVEKLSQRYHWRLSTPFEAGLVQYAGLTPLGVSGWNGRPDIQANAVTMPLAICRAALLTTLEQES